MMEVNPEKGYRKAKPGCNGLIANYFCKKAPAQAFDVGLNKPAFLIERYVNFKTIYKIKI